MRLALTLESIVVSSPTSATKKLTEFQNDTPISLENFRAVTSEKLSYKPTLLEKPQEHVAKFYSDYGNKFLRKMSYQFYPINEPRRIRLIILEFCMMRLFSYKRKWVLHHVAQ